MALLGPQGLRELGETILYKANYAVKLLSEIESLKVPFFESACFKEFTVNFDQTDLAVNEVNKELLEHGIQGGKDVSKEFPELGQTALYCVTEIHSKEEIQRLQCVLKETLEQW
jgi:glycine dehydrogenase subunit 1